MKRLAELGARYRIAVLTGTALATLVSVGGALNSRPVSPGPQKPRDATIVDPDAHRVLFENEHVRVIDARAGRGWKSAMHSHPPMLVINLGSGRQKVTWPDGKTQLVDLNPGAVVWQGQGFDHAWEQLAGDVNVILVEVKSARAATRP